MTLDLASVKRLLAERGLRPNPGLGQNFMLDPNLIAFLVACAEAGPRDVILEPGAGPAALTEALLATDAVVVAVELDAGLHALARDRLGGAPNLRLLHADVMGPGDTVNESVMAAVRRELAGRACFKVAANLPYRVSTALIAALLTGDPPPERMVVTVQKEVADRLTAPPGSRDFGYLTVLVQSAADTERLRTLPPGCFWPQPEVHSAMIRITPDPRRRLAPGHLEKLRRLAGALFTHRRKQTARALVQEGLFADRPAAERFLAGRGVDPAARPESLPVAAFVALAAALP